MVYLNTVVREEDPKQSENEFKRLYDPDHDGTWSQDAADRSEKKMLPGGKVNPAVMFLCP